jgi:hypothetical protein
MLKQNLNISNLSRVCYARRLSSYKWQRRLAKMLRNCNAFFEWFSLEQVYSSEFHDISAETQAMLDPLLLLSLLVTTAEHIVSINIFRAGRGGTCSRE